MAIRPIANASFEDGNANGWEIPGGIAYVVGTQDNTPFGTQSLRFTTGTPGLIRMHSAAYVPVVPGKQITASCYYTQGPAPAWRNVGNVLLTWYDENQDSISESVGTIIYSTGSNGSVQAVGFAKSTVTAPAPDGAAFVRIGMSCNKDRPDYCGVDNFVWDYEEPGATALVTSPTAAGVYAEGSTIPFRASFTVDPSFTVVSSKYIVRDVLTNDLVAELVPASNTAPWAVNDSSLVAGDYKVTVEFTLNTDEVATSPEVEFTVGDPPTPDTREYRASNAGTNLVMENFAGIAAAIPSTALVTGAELVVDYELAVLSRSLDRDLAPDAADPDAVFSVVNAGLLEATLLDNEGTSYSVVGAPMTTDVPVLRSDFTLNEEGLSEGYKWAVFESNTAFQAVIGSSTTLFGTTVMAVPDFLDRSVGLRFTPIAGTIPSTSLNGNAAVRIKLNTVRLRVYFDAGSVEYYFKNPAGTEIIKGTLVSANVLSGDLRNGDAAGVLQLSAELDFSGSGQYNRIIDGWTIHSHSPATDANLIGVVDGDMQYNSLPSYAALSTARTRTEIITANFYGDERLNSMYGVNGVGRAFSYNGEDFYKIYTQPDADKDMPRHLAYHHAHLALGYREGRVDISVVGEPFNFDGALGASSWGIGDGVTGMLTLSGTILGIFGSNSVTGLSGTTVDNFATQTISAKMGAVEYTIADMGYPVYANSYGIYTLSQVQQYGDYMGTPLSQDISPWLRPRLVRKDISEKEVIAAWPVRSKNQYRLAFADGYVLTMTVNNGQQTAPTFSKQKYFHDIESGELYDAPAIVPAAISSQLDEGGEERIHIANAQPVVYGSVVIPPEEEVQYKLVTETSPDGTTVDIDGSGNYTLKFTTTTGNRTNIMSNVLNTFFEPNYTTSLNDYVVTNVEMFFFPDSVALPLDIGTKGAGYQETWVRRTNAESIPTEDTTVITISYTTSDDEINVVIANDSSVSEVYLYRVTLTHPTVEGNIYAVGLVTLNP